ncbi:winged helix-turn-helix transcriptional regulator [Asticcacaulis machinosus]|uniref:Helix-turn-helix domain-containing protein n=1 Tax=Asticcacaulis machinosus TaxID=2984211 RepID=A0ABT5HKW2_9CAUL|nr:helix-turn-helix domain-containing protein [Asticcacaulis machinosus]MDC7676254.1 helix-turn-helix domain-containing protein [Asticcacaulis machinosus]
MGRSADYSSQNCAVAAALDVVGDPWTLLIIRDAFRGISRFDQFQEKLGLARNVLAARLKMLVAEELLSARVYNERPRRYEYVLTAKGADLALTITGLYVWGKKYVYGEHKSRVEISHKTCGHPLVEPICHCAHCGERMERKDLVFDRDEDAITIGELKALKGKVD